MPAKLRALSTLSLLAALGPIHRSSVRFETPAPAETPEAPEKPAAAAAPAKPTLLQQVKAFKAAAGDRAVLISRAEKAEAQIKTRDGELLAVQKENTDLKARVTVLESERAEAEQTMTALMDEAQHVDHAASTRAAAIAGAQGIPERHLPALGADGAAGESRSKELAATYKKLIADGKSSEAAAFYAKHEKEMLT